MSAAFYIRDRENEVSPISAHGGPSVPSGIAATSILEDTHERHHQSIPERKVVAKRLGRNIHFDLQSATLPVNELFRPKAVVKSRVWGRPGPFDQGDTGSCTGQAVAGLVMTAPIADTGVDEGTAMEIYELATKIDPFPSSYPPDDTGSSVLAAMQAAQQRGYITSYRWCFSLQDVLQALSTVGPVAIGINWYTSFDQPDTHGHITLAPGATIRGGHALNLTSVDTNTNRVGGWNSWGANWGVGGQVHDGLADTRHAARSERRGGRRPQVVD